jgi:uncharacterized protein YbjT (DUF2867 family)
LKSSAIASTIIRPTGFFSDMKDVLDMARKGTIWLFGNGEFRINPVHGQDLVEAVLHHSLEGTSEIALGGPNTYTTGELAALALDAWSEVNGNKGRIRYAPDAIRKLILAVLPRVTPLSFYGPIQFFLAAMGMDALGEPVGNRSLADFFHQEVRRYSHASTSLSGGS